eukprot:scaffold39173_cov59-Phaeocystis_antarctica.AAC.1
MVTVTEEMDVAEIASSVARRPATRVLPSSTVRSVMFCWMMVVEDGLAVVATSRMVSATAAWRAARIPVDRVKSTETVALKGGGGGEGGGHGGEGGEGGEGGCVGGEGGDDGDGSGQLPKTQLEP